MNLRSAVKFGLAPSLLLGSLAMGAPGADVQADIGYLLQHVEDSGCEFYRNGTWYNGTRARAHLNEKYRYLVAMGEISTTDDFIELAATKSSITGIPYQIRCPRSAAVGSRAWLQDALATYHRQRRLALPAR